MSEQYDIIIVGGGIHGVGVAQAAAARGYSALLIEKTDLASGTSSRSSKLIHGGLRYLESGQFSLVRECLRERAVLLHIASDLVQLRDFYLPVYQNTRRRPWQLRTGLTLYAMLAGFAKAAWFTRVPRTEWDTLDGLTTQNLQAVFRYRDAQTDDAQLTRAVMRSAENLGAERAVPARFCKATLREDFCTVDFIDDGKPRSCQAEVVVNATGPWANQVLARIHPRVPVCPVDLVQGAHLVIDAGVDRGIYYLESPGDGRGIFIMPWHDRALVGTTETPYRGDPDHVHPLDAELSYLLDVLRHYFPRFTGIHTDDVTSSFAGLRVLPSGSNPSFHRSRESLLHVDRPERPRVLTIYGGKLTTYRITAQKVMNQLASVLPVRSVMADTSQLKLAA